MVKKLSNMLSLCGGLGLCGFILLICLLVYFYLNKIKESFSTNICWHKRKKNKTWLRVHKGHIENTKAACKKYSYRINNDTKERLFDKWSLKKKECCVRPVY